MFLSAEIEAADSLGEMPWSNKPLRSIMLGRGSNDGWDSTREAKSEIWCFL